MSTTNGSSSSLGAGSDMFTSIQTVISHMMGGGVRAKQRGCVTFTEAFSYMGDQLIALSRRMSEPDQNYPSAIWEPLAKTGAHLKAASQASGEGSSAITALLQMNVGELASSPLKAPHHQELNAE